MEHVERTLVILKPDAVQRALVGELITRFEKKGLKIVALKMLVPSRSTSQKHYSMPESDMVKLGERTIAAYKEKGIENTKKPMEIATWVIEKLVDYLAAGPVVPMVIEGAHAIAHVRKIRGHTNPLSADIGSITADFTVDSYFMADAGDRAVRNLVHASGSLEEANREIALWFSEKEICNYRMAIDEILYTKDWEKGKESL